MRTNNYLFIVTEHCEGMTLKKRVESNQRFSEGEAKYIIKQITWALYHCQLNKVVHRDIKPENIIINDDLHVTLLDFGFAKLTSKKWLKSVIGSPMYMAPEVFNGKYTNKSDIWSVGVLTYYILSGFNPFEGDDMDEVKRRVQACQYTFPSSWDTLSPLAKLFVKSTMTADYEERLNYKQAVHDPWLKSVFYSITSGLEQSPLYSFDILVTLRNFQCNDELKKLCMVLLAKMQYHYDIIELKQQFNLIDVNKDGFITIDELGMAMQVIEGDITNTEVKRIMKRCAFTSKTKIKFTEFVAIAIGDKLVPNINMFKVINKTFDVDEKNFIDRSDVKRIAHNLGIAIPIQDLNGLMELHDEQGGEMILFKEIREMFDLIFDL